MNYSEHSNKNDATWPDPLWAAGYSYTSVPQSTHPDLISTPGYLSTAGPHVPDSNTTDYAAFTPAPTTEMGMYTNLPTTQVDFTSQNVIDPWSMPDIFPDFNAPTAEMGAVANPLTQADYTNPNVLDPWSMPGPSHFDANSAVSQPQPVGDPHWTGVDPLAAYSVAATPDLGVSPTSTTPTSPNQDEWAWLSDILQSPHTTPASYPGEAGWVAPEPGVNLSEVTTSLAGWDTSGPSWPIPAAPGDVTSDVTKTFAPAAVLGKRRHEAEQPLGDGGPATHTQDMPPPKRARGGGTAKGIHKAGRSAARARCKPAARIPGLSINGKPKEAGRGAERLATPSSQGIYHQSLPGPSSQQGCAVDAADGTPTWVEGSVDGRAVHHIDSTVQQQHEEATAHFKIPRIFKPDYRMFLQASEADFARGAVQAIKCRLCPDTKLKDFEEFKRHCRTSEMHPLEIYFCDRCGDFFARSDALLRHHRRPPDECKVTERENAAKKRRVTEEEYERFIRRLRHGLMTGEYTGRPFSHIIKELFPESSKKRTGGRT